MTFNITRTLYSEERFEKTKAINKCIYICILDSIDENNLDEAIKIVKTFSSKEFMQLLLKEDIFYDLPVYHSLILKGINNKYLLLYFIIYIKICNIYIYIYFLISIKFLICIFNILK